LDEVAGAAVASVQPGTAAARAGLMLGDVIVALDSQPIRTANELTASLARRQPGEKVRLTVVRERKRRDFTVELGQFETTAPTVAKGSKRPAAEELLGFQAAPLTPELASRFGIQGKSEGVVITGVTPFGPAAA